MTPGPTDKPKAEFHPAPKADPKPVPHPTPRASTVSETGPRVATRPPAAPPKPKSPLELALGSKFDPKAHYRVVGPAEEQRLLSITDPTTGDPDTTGADPTGAKGTFTVVGAFEDGRKILQATGVRPTR